MPLTRQQHSGERVFENKVCCFLCGVWLKSAEIEKGNFLYSFFTANLFSPLFSSDVVSVFFAKVKSDVIIFSPASLTLYWSVEFKSVIDIARLKLESLALKLMTFNHSLKGSQIEFQWFFDMDKALLDCLATGDCDLFAFV